MRTLSIFSMLAWAGAALSQEPRAVVLATNRDGRVEVFNALTLATLGTLAIHPLAESTSASPDGRTLYIAQESESTPGGCCGLFALDLETRRMCPVISPSLFGAPSPDGRFLFTQRGNSGIDVFDARTLQRLPTMKAPGVYSLHPSPGGQWLFGVTNWPAPSLDIFDVERGALAHRLPLPEGPATGAWAGDRFYVFSYGDQGGQLWAVGPDDRTLPPAKPIYWDLPGSCDEPMPLMLAGARDSLFLAEAFGFKVDRRRACPDTVHGGIYVIEPSSGRVHDYIGGEVYVNRMVASADGRTLYVLDSFGPDEKEGTRLLRLDVRTGRILASRESHPGVWNLALAQIPDNLIPRGRVQAVACRH